MITKKNHQVVKYWNVNNVYEWAMPQKLSVNDLNANLQGGWGGGG